MVVQPVIIVLAVLLLAGLAEFLHARRVRGVGYLAFGPSGRPRRWVRAVPFLRVLSLALMGWGFSTLLTLDPKMFDEEELPESEMKRLVIAYDVSPSMNLKDAGPERDQYRSRRASEMVYSIMERIQLQQTRISVIAFFSDAAAAVIDAKDGEVVRNIFDDLPLKFAFKKDKTRLLRGVEEAVELSKTWPRRSTTLMVISDGDTIPEDELPPLPDSIDDVIVIGVGPTDRGTFIDGHFSQQDVATLSSLASHYGGWYHDGNELNVPSERLGHLAVPVPGRERFELGLREWAILSIALGAFLFAFLPVLLTLAGSSWRIDFRRADKKGAIS